MHKASLTKCHCSLKRGSAGSAYDLVTRISRYCCSANSTCRSNYINIRSLQSIVLTALSSARLVEVPDLSLCPSLSRKWKTLGSPETCNKGSGREHNSMCLSVAGGKWVLERRALLQGSHIRSDELFDLLHCGRL